MAFMDQTRKARIEPKIKSILKTYGVKGSLAVRDHMTLVLNIREGAIDFIGNYNRTVSERPGEHRTGSPAKDSLDVNPYWYHEHFTGKAKRFLGEVLAAMNDGNHDRSDSQTDYFDVGWYVDVNIGRWNKPYKLAA